ncbi:putative two-component system response regulator [Clostridiales Family XIII bacterium PM5-7]
MRVIPKILIVDDEPANLKLLKELLKDTYQVYLATSGKHALNFLEHNKPDAILLDVLMPEMDGYEVIKEIKKRESVKDIPVIFLTGLDNQNNESIAFKLGAVDYITKPIVAESVLNRLAIHVELQQYRQNLEAEIALRTAKLVKTQEVILNIMANLTEIKDNDTGAHVKRTTAFMQLLVEGLSKLQQKNYRLSKEEELNVINTSKLHDIGKVAIPDTILLKPGKLTDEEFEHIKTHSTVGAKVIEDAMEELGDAPSFFKTAYLIIISHHEKWDGSGYPFGLSGEAIPLPGRLMAIADVYDALVSVRPYKKAMSHEEALAIIVEGAGKHFDPFLVEKLYAVIDGFKNVDPVTGIHMLSDD